MRRISPRSVRRVSLTLAVLVFACSSGAQQTDAPAIPAPLTGSVTAYVSDDISRTPIRFAEIVLVPVPEDLNSGSHTYTPETSEDLRKNAHRLQSVIGSSTLDGTVRMDGVPVGDYLISVRKLGYITAVSSASLEVSNDELKKIMASLPLIHIAQGTTSTVNLTLHPGAVLAGRMQFADGSPAVGAVVTWQKLEKQPPRDALPVYYSPLQEALSSFVYTRDTRVTISTDDEGCFRIFGLPPGRFIVSTGIALDHSTAALTMRTNGESSRASGREHIYPEIISVYAPSAFRQADARIFVIKGDERILDADIKIDTAGLHSLKGRVLAASDLHAPTTMLQVREQGAAALDRFAEVEDDGSFQFNYLPSGSYELEIEGIDILPSDASSKSERAPLRYSKKSITAIIGEQDVVMPDILITPLKPGEKWW